MHLGTKTCPQCGKLMVEKEPGIILDSYPAQYDRVWWCGCGYREYEGRVFERTGDEWLREKWELMNGTVEGGGI